ncbi:oriC-binding nucleoid-associated protein [Enterobacter sp. R1(2018)]|nr:oriC-binding nucleoid-associated protein [Enterobacter sp. R1(2018)]RKQ38037.1 oriC-binding nucleoid-associated protein [Enterobacter sp. R1(2018)]
MKAHVYLATFSKITASESPEKLFDLPFYRLAANHNLININCPADYRRAERVSDGQLFAPGRMPKCG